MTTQKKGFTLVELSIVLVIIGLLIGGVLKGQSMIENAKVKRVMSDVDSLVSATYSYQDKFNALPGDDASTVAANGVANGAAACAVVGNGNGLIDTAPERLCAYQDLIDEGFLTGNAAGTTEVAVARTTPFGSSFVFRSGVVNGANQNFIGMLAAAVPADVAQSIDSKFDDGIWNTGDITSGTIYTNTATKNLSFVRF
jgi:prepilin-type N-terminal cleavage/methylation domain-containing protein